MEEEKLLLEEEKEFKRFYRLSVWWVVHRTQLRRLGLGLLAAFDVILLLFVFWTFLDSFAVSYGDDERAVARLVAYGQADLRAYTAAHAADPIVAKDARVFPIGSDRFDFYAELSNPNTDWWAEFRYEFIHEGGRTPGETGFLLPGQAKPFFALAFNSQTPIRDAIIELTDITWHRLDRHVIQDYETWQDDRLRLEVSDAAFTRETGFEEEAFGRTTFTVFNNTAFGYFDPEFIVLLKRGAAVVGVNRATVASLGPGERAELSLNWFGTLPSVSSVEVIPDVHLFDPSIYQRLEGTQSIDTRTRTRTR